MNLQNQWATADLSRAMHRAITQSANERCLSQKQDKILFNGFWRNGSHQNVCAWLDKATWHDIKTGDGGSCKDFAKTAYNMSLPDFMKAFGQPSDNLDIGQIFRQGPQKQPDAPIITKPPNEIWEQLVKRDQHREDLAAQWLINERGFKSPRRWIGSGFANLTSDDLDLFGLMHHKLIKERLTAGPQLIAPIRSVHSDEVKNLFFRTIAKVDKKDKSRLLTGAGGWSEPDGTPRAFGFPHLIHDFPNIAIFEGMADHFAGELLLASNEKWLPLGGCNADSLKKWALWLSKRKYSGKVNIVYQLDPNDDGELTAEETGPMMAVKAMQIFKENGINAEFFNWQFYLENTTDHPENITDLADSILQDAHLQECAPDHLSYCFELALTLPEGSHQ